MVTDFKSGEDVVMLAGYPVSGLVKSMNLEDDGEYKLAARCFRANATGAAMDKDDHILYNTKTGALLYDKDGKGGAAAVQFATLKNKPKNISAADFLVVK